MGRIEETLKNERERASLQEKDAPVPITGSNDSDSEIIDFSRLPSVIPDEDLLAANRIVSAQLDAPERSVYKVLRTRVLQRLRAAQWNVIGVTGASQGEGKTLTAINLAYSLSQDVSHSVVLIDLDLRRPSIHGILGLKPKNDLSNFLDGSAKLAEILVRPDEKRLAIMTNQTAHKDSSEILSSPEIEWLIRQLRNLGPKTITIIDLPPVLAGDDVIAFAPLIDALLLVVGQGTCRRDDLVETYELLQDANILGVILNRAREHTLKSGYYDYYK
jgi:capsular exopolysaccharide synthesis family protein